MPLNPALFANVPQARVDPAAFDTSNALNRAMQVSQFIQQNELARRKLAETDMLKNALANVDLSDPQSVANLVRIPGGAQVAASLQQFQTGQQTASKAALADRMKMFEANLARVRSPGEAKQWVTAVSQDPVLRPHLSEMGFDPLAEMGQIPRDDAGIPKWKSDLLATPESIREAAKPLKLSAGESVGTVTPDGKLNIFGTAPARPAQPLAPSITEIQDPTNPLQTLSVDARVYKGGGLGSPGVIGLGVPKAPPAPRTPVAVVGPDGPVFVSPEEAIGKTPAAAMEGLTPKEKQKREAAYPKSTSALKTTEQDIDQMVKDIQTLLTDPGLNSITGLVYGRTPSVTREGRRAQALYDKIIAKGGFQMLSNMRAASPTGGALGNVSDREGVQLRAAFAALDRTQDAADVKQVLTDLITQLGATKTNLREAYDLTYEYRTGGGAAPTSGGWSIVK